MEQENRSSEIRFIEPGQNSWVLGKNVHVWKFPVAKTGLSLLTPSEEEFAGRFRFEGDRNRFVVGRQSLRLLLSKYLSVPPMEIIVSSEKNHKPFLNSPSSLIHFNISHSGDWILIAFAIGELGIDIEKIKPGFHYKDLLQEHFSEAEQSYISGESNPVHAFYFLWTRKEALTKAWGTGLQENLKMVHVLDDSRELFEMRNQFWKLESFNISSVYPAALAYSGELENILYFDGTGNLIRLHHVQSK